MSIQTHRRLTALEQRADLLPGKGLIVRRLVRSEADDGG